MLKTTPFNIPFLTKNRPLLPLISFKSSLKSGKSHPVNNFFPAGS